MTGLEKWLSLATQKLAKDSVAKVRSEISDHYESARNAAIAEGLDHDEASRRALNVLGDAKVSNCQYRRVLMTSTEAAMLRESSQEARAVCSRLWLKWLLLALPVIPICAASALFFEGKSAIAQELLIAGFAMSLLLSASFLPIYTPLRSRIFRIVKWLAMTGALLLLFGPAAREWSWLLICCLWPVAWTEWTRASIRRKLPVAAWPKHLYL